MKRMISFVLIASLLFSGCSILDDRIREPVTFYYLEANMEQLRPEDEIFVGEVREASGHRNDLTYLMALYLIGPTSEELAMPLARGTKITSAVQNGSMVQITLTDTEKTMTDIEYTLACTCLSMTCLELTNAQFVTINSGERSITMSRDSLVLQDHTAAKPTEDTP